MAAKTSTAAPRRRRGAPTTAIDDDAGLRALLQVMKGDRESCLEAGASGYIAKPVQSDELLSMLRQWLHR
ncbi:MAG TPA: hypothetical protein VFG21_02420 [Xanthomonadaceae bacterium]|nr:hypothetical protein [Xanthomonadaceae bacterium]